MNTKKTDEDEPRYGCDNWDRPNVKYRSKGRGVVPQRKVVTTGTARIRMPESMAESLTRHLRQGKEVHFTVGGKALFRAFPLASVDGRRIYAGMQAMTALSDKLADKRPVLLHGGKVRSQREYDEMAARKRGERTTEVTPDMMVECPSCGFTFRVGTRQGE